MEGERGANVEVDRSPCYMTLADERLERTIVSLTLPTMIAVDRASVTEVR